MFKDDVISQIDRVAGEYIDDQTYKHKKRKRPFSFVLVPRSWFQAIFGSAEAGFVCIRNGAVEVRAHNSQSVTLFFEEPSLRFVK